MKVKNVTIIRLWCCSWINTPLITAAPVLGARLEELQGEPKGTWGGWTLWELLQGPGAATSTLNPGNVQWEWCPGNATGLWSLGPGKFLPSSVEHPMSGLKPAVFFIFFLHFLPESTIQTQPELPKGFYYLKITFW